MVADTRTDSGLSNPWRRPLVIADSMLFAAGLGMALNLAVGFVLVGLFGDALSWGGVFGLLAGLVLGIWVARRLHRDRDTRAVSSAHALSMAIGALLSGGICVWLSWEAFDADPILLTLLALVGAALGALVADTAVDLVTTRATLALDVGRVVLVAGLAGGAALGASNPDFGMAVLLYTGLAVLAAIVATVWDLVASWRARVRTQNRAGTPGAA